MKVKILANGKLKEIETQEIPSYFGLRTLGYSNEDLENGFSIHVDPPERPIDLTRCPGE